MEMNTRQKIILANLVTAFELFCQENGWNNVSITNGKCHIDVQGAEEVMKAQMLTFFGEFVLSSPSVDREDYNVEAIVHQFSNYFAELIEKSNAPGTQPMLNMLRGE